MPKLSPVPSLDGPMASGNPFSFGCLYGLILLALLGGGCAVKFSAELLAPLNKSGREEISRPVPPSPPAATPAPAPPPSPSPSPMTPLALMFGIEPCELRACDFWDPGCPMPPPGPCLDGKALGVSDRDLKAAMKRAAARTQMEAR